jgi:tetratricopeptide (TPR) repeat protein
MKIRKLYIVILALFFMLCFLACGTTTDSYKQGQEFTKDSRWEEAIVYFENALKDDPENQEIKDSLSSARKEAAKARIAKLRVALASDEQTIPALEKLSRDAGVLVSMDPNNSEIKALQGDVNEKLSNLKVTLRSLYQQAEVDVQKEEWVEAISKLNQINKIFPNYEDTARKLARAKQEGIRILYQQAINYGKNEDWKTAAETFKTVIDVNPNYLDASKQYRDAKQKDSLDYYITEGSKAEAARNWERAVILYDKAGDYQQPDEAMARKMEILKAKVGQIFLEEASRLTKQGKLYAAMKKLEGVRKYVPDAQNNHLYKEYSTNACDALMRKAEKLGEKELWGNALFWMQKIEAVNPNYPDLFQKMIEVKDHINKGIRKSIAVFDFSSPSADKDAGKIAANKLIAYLHKNASADLRIIERESLQSILKEMQLTQTGLVDIKTAQSVGKMQGIDTFIMGDVLHFSTKYTDSPSINQVKVLIDEEDVRNPEFSDWLMINPRPTEEDMKNAPARTIKKKNYQLISYKQGVAKINALLEISFKLVNTQTGENIYTTTVSGKLIKDDKYQDGVPIAGIVQDPLELPTEAEVLDEITNDKVSDMGRGILKHFQSLELEYYNDGQSQQKRRNIDAAIEKYTNAIFDEKLKGISTPISQKSSEMIDKLLADK